MYVCLCKQITEKQIKKAIQQGAVSLDAIQERTGASSECGCCMDSIQEMLSEYCISASNIPVINSANEPLPQQF